MKKILITATVLFLTACSSTPNIVGTNKPILNMAANLAPALDVDLSDNTAALTQVWPNQQESQSGNILLQPQEKKVFELPKPSTESTNYRLYLQ